MAEKSNTSSVVDKANELAAKGLSAAGLPTSISDVPNWFRHFVGIAKDSRSAWEDLKQAVENPTQENIVKAAPVIGPASVAMAKDVQKGDYLGAGATLAGTVAIPVTAGATASAGDIAAEVENEVHANQAENNVKGVVEGQGLVYKGELTPGSKVHMFEDPKYPGKTAALNEEDITPEAVREKMGSKLKEFETTTPKSKISPPTIRVYHGEGGAAGAGGGGGWASTDPGRAASYGGKVHATDLTQQEYQAAQQSAKNAGSNTRGDVLLNSEQQARAKPVVVPSPRVELTPSSSTQSMQEQGEAIWGSPQSGLRQVAPQSNLSRAINQ